MRLIILAPALLALAFFAGPAAAQDAVVFGDGLVNLGPFYEALAVVISGVVLAVGGAAIRFAQVKWGISLGDHYNAVLDQAIERGVSYAIRQLPAGVPVENDIIELAADYVIDKAPGALKRFKLTRESVRQMVQARLPAPPATGGVP